MPVLESAEDLVISRGRRDKPIPINLAGNTSHDAPRDFQFDGFRMSELGYSCFWQITRGGGRGTGRKNIEEKKETQGYRGRERKARVLCASVAAGGSPWPGMSFSWYGPQMTAIVSSRGAHHGVTFQSCDIVFLWVSRQASAACHVNRRGKVTWGGWSLRGTLRGVRA
ncbi:hypothetical protein RRG08_012447 [Elysia crispata]|uniref:Uncharacterized protein n=1 Tax=Elysia crispata TaxID=231223 RepID=A0AAE1E9M6_9GAST|nr:hypothetical protein RRG08_012447 [Elysia crispata]